MPYSKLRKNDIFVSYAHYDDAEGWVKHFGRLLENKLKRQLKILEHGRETDITVWTDASLPSSGALLKRLEQEIADSSLLMVIMSESYLVSEWCRKEGEMFIDSLKGNRELRIVIAEKEKTDRNDWPTYLKDESGSALISEVFYEETHVGKYRTIPMRNNTGEFNSEAGNLMEELCVSICEELQNQNSNRSIHRVGISKRIFIALCPSDEGDAVNYTQELRQRLGSLSNIEILPPLIPEEFENSLKERLANCDLVVQILDNQKGSFLSKRKTGFVGHQYEEAQGKHIPILQWKVPGVLSTAEPDSPYQQFLAGLKLLGEAGGTLVGGESLDEFFAAIQAALKVDKIAPNAVNIESIRVEIRSLREDRKEAGKVGQAIKERSMIWNQGRGGAKIRIRPIVLYDDAKAEDLDLLAKLSRGTVIVYAKNYKWVDENEQKVSSETNRIGRIAHCDPTPKDVDFVSLGNIDMSSDANSAERNQQIDAFLEELVSALTSNK